MVRNPNLVSQLVACVLGARISERERERERERDLKLWMHIYDTQKTGFFVMESSEMRKKPLE